MHRKNIRQMVLKQLKYNHPHWKRMTKKSKKILIQEVVDEVVKKYFFANSPTISNMFHHFCWLENTSSVFKFSK
jgi:hypothetical protein